jgi:tetratricopeptide (TPR) repeat protein
MLDKVNQFVAGQEAGEKATEEAYQSAIAIADKEFGTKNYESARHEYQRALEIKPTEPYPKSKIQEIDGLLADLVKNKKRDENYQAAVSRGDSLLGIRDYGKARTAYTEASTLKPSETYPKEKLAAISAVLAEQAKQKQSFEKEYADLILSGEKLFKSGSLEPAKVAFSKALEMKPGESLPKRRIASIDSLSDLLVRQKSLDDQYSGIITAADKHLLDKSFEVAKAEYLKASALKPSEIYPKTKIREIEKSLADLAALKSKDSIYSASVAAGDNFLASKSYDQAKTEYQKALKVKPDEAYPKGKIGEIDLALSEIAKLKSTDEKYQLSISKADKLLASKSYPEARLEFTTAAALKPSEAYPAQKIGEIDKILADIAKQKALDDEYKGIIADAEKLFAAKSLDQAKSAYQKALELKPAKELPKRRIVSIDSLSDMLAKQKSLDEQYSGLIAGADKLLQDKSYEQAKTQYNKGLTLKLSEIYPRTKISEIDKILADIGAARTKDSAYSVAIAEGDKLMAARSYDLAKSEYQRALKVKPDETYPKGRIAEIDNALAEIAKQKSIDEKYQLSISKADQLLGAKSYPGARLEYTSAAALKPSETYPAQKIGEIDKILADSIAKQKSLEEQYSALIAGADKLLQDKSYEQAKTQYNKGLTLKPSEIYPVTKISEIDKILAGLAAAKTKDSTYAAIISEGDKLLSAKSYDQAKTEYQKALKIKPDEASPKLKITEADNALAEIAKQKSIDEKYQLSISKADQLLASKSYPEARLEYTNASAFKPTETYPVQKIGEIDKILAEIARQKVLDEQYGSIIANAEKLFAAKTLDQAKSGYQKALELKPAEELPKRRIASIDSISDVIAKQTALDQQYKGIIAGADKLLQGKSYEQSRAEYRKASELKPAENYPKTKISEIDKILADLAASRARDSAYSAAIASGDKLMAAKTWDEAKTEYQRALQLKPDEAYPKTKITEADNALAEAARQKALDEKYQADIQKADQLLLSGDFAQARAAYVEAGKIKPGETYPQDKIKETDGRIAEAARQKTLEDRYKTAIGKADQLLTSKSYDQAKTEYNNALSIKPGEQYPADKIKEIESIMAEIRAREEAYKTSVLKADQLLADKKFDEARTEYENAQTIKPNEQYPKNKIDEINRKLVELQGRKKTFDDLVIKGDNSFNDKDWGKSREYFQQASGLFPDEKYPKDRLERLTTVIDSIYRANKGKYDKAIAEADKFFNGFEFDKAIDGYSEAAGYLPMENYPKEMIARIRRTLAENAIADVLNSPVTITSNDEKQFKFTPVNIASRKDNFIYIKIRNLSGKPFNVLLRYGKDKQPSGGIVIRNLSTDGKINERLISVREQDVWYRIDNDFISLYPQGGDIEVSFIQVSKAR